MLRCLALGFLLLGSVADAASDAPKNPLVLWQQYQQELAHNAARHSEHTQEALHTNGKTLRYASFEIGVAPAHGYPLYIALHGGGSAPPWVNDSQWDMMKVYYRDSVHEGVYVAPRGVTDSWDLHFQPETYVLIDRLIQNMVAYENVDPDRVYLTGYSAGGDGVYQITPRLADRFAAANMSAGHPNGVGLGNLASVPFLLQVGERDAAFHRNTVTAETNDKLDALVQSKNGEYVHAAFVHVGRPHNFLDNDARERPNQVFANPHGWLTGEDRSVRNANTNAIRWMSQYTRNPFPDRVVWDLTTRAAGKNQFYWLGLGNRRREKLGTDTVRATLDTASNTVRVEEARTYLEILLNEAMLDLSQPVHVLVDGQRFDVQARPTLTNQLETLQQRGDPRYIFSAKIVLEQDATGWRVVL